MKVSFDEAWTLVTGSRNQIFLNLIKVNEKVLELSYLKFRDFLVHKVLVFDKSPNRIGGLFLLVFLAYEPIKIPFLPAVISEVCMVSAFD